MPSRHLTAADREVWDAFVAQEPHFGLLQSWEWGEFKERLGWRAIRIGVWQDKRIVAGAQLLFKSILPGFPSIAYLPRGPLGQWLDPCIASELLAEIHQTARRLRAIFLRIEPPLENSPIADQCLRQLGLLPNPCTNQPRATLILDISQDLDTVLKEMRGKTRQYIRSAERKGVTVRVGGREDLASFYQLMQVTSKRENFTPRTRAYYEQEWQILGERNHGVLLMAFYHDQLLATRTVHCFGSHAAEFHAGSSGEYANVHPNYLLVWEAIKWAKTQGCHTYDLWGIPDEVGQSVYAGNPLPASDRTDGLWGVYRFKTGFTKNLIYYLGAYDYVYVPWLYAMAIRGIKVNTLERVAARLESSACERGGKSNS